MTRINTVTILLLLATLGCDSPTENKSPIDNYKLNQPLITSAPYDEGYPITEEDIDKEAPYKIEDYVNYYKDFYGEKTTLPPFDYAIDLSKKTFSELRMLRAEILARHGFLFMDYVLRSHFNKFDWYQPIFWYNDFKIKLNEEEKNFIDRVLRLEQELYKKNYIVVDGTKKANIENVANWVQFETIPKEMMDHLENDGFVINKGNYEQLFHIYDENYYDYTPSFITTDLYLQVLHMHISKEMQALEEEKMIPILTELITDEYNSAKKTAQTDQNKMVKSAAAWNQVYYAVALSLLTDKKQEVPAEYQANYDFELESTGSAQGRKSEFLGDSLMDYTQFQPRGNYSRTDELKHYFKCVKWLNSASIYLDNDDGLSSVIVMGKSLLDSEASLERYRSFSNVINFLAGEENNLSIFNILKILKEYPTQDVDKLVSSENLTKIRKALYAADPRKMQPKGGNMITKDFLARKKLLFTAGRYTFDGEVLQRLVHITRPNPKRKFPKGLDVFAAMGNKDAEDILLNVYKEQQQWAGYPDTLNVLKKKFASFNKWDISVYNKKMETILSLQQNNVSAPFFMQLPNWQKKNLNTMLASWTGLKHDMILYIEQPSGAEMGDGGEIPPPQKIAYVEPQVAFWKKCIELLQLNKKMLEENGVLTERIESLNNELQEMAELFVGISEKELTGEHLSSEEFDELSFIGGQVESLTLNIIESSEGFIQSVQTPERYMAIAADVYTYNDSCLEEANGMGDAIYVIAEINGLLYLTRGAVFSQYEFTQPTAERLTDEAWQKQLLEHKEPATASWMKDIKIDILAPKTAPNFNLY